MSAEPIHIPLRHGLAALIDAKDAHLAGLKWYAKKSDGGTIYAARNDRDEHGRRITVRLHTAVIGLPPAGQHIDHISGDGLDCRRANLRFVTPTENARNRYPAARRDNGTSPYLGVNWVPRNRKFVARICVSGRSQHLGYFDTAEDANAARLTAERTIWGVTPRRAEAHGATA